MTEVTQQQEQLPFEVDFHCNQFVYFLLKDKSLYKIEFHLILL